ncbi:MAG: DUF2339 domain-containing protein, partial [Rhizobiales bacterium]|nr:DUF2339 domain-containing protein [Hyphomicrobiales bacterium]
LLAAATVAIAWRAPSVGAAVPVAAVLVALVIAEWAVPYARETLVGPVTGLEGRAQAGSHMVFGAVFAVLFGAAGFRAQGRYARALPPILWSATAAAAPTLILVALYYRVADAERSIPFAALALLLAALYATATEILAKRERRPGLTSAEALFAVSAVASLALALTMALEKGWLTVALALMAPGIAMIAERRPLPMLRWLAAAVAVAVVGRVMWEPRIVGADIGTTPIFNWLLWGYGVPALCFWFTAARLRRRADDTPCRILDSAAILFTVLTLTLEIRHYVNGGDIYRAGPRLLEYGMQASALLAVAIGLERVRGRSGSIVHNIGAVVVAGLALCVIVFGLLVGENPLFTRVNVGGAVINLLLVAYGIPAVLAITLALVARGTRPMRYRAVAAAASVVLTLTYLSLQVRRFFQGPVLHIDGLPGESG